MSVFVYISPVCTQTNSIMLGQGRKFFDEIKSIVLREYHDQRRKKCERVSLNSNKSMDNLPKDLPARPCCVPGGPVF